MAVVNAYNPDLAAALASAGVGGSLGWSGDNSAAGGLPGGITGGTPQTGVDGTTQFPNYVKTPKPDGMATSAPANPKSGDQYWDDTLGVVRTYDESSAKWTNAPGTPAAMADPNVVATNVTLPGGQTTQLTSDEAAAQKALQNDVAAGQTSLSNATSTQADALNALTAGFNAQIAAMQQQTAAATSALGSGGSDLSAQIAAEQQTFAKSQADLLGQMQDQTAAQSKAMGDLIQQLQNTTAQSAQKARAPNYARALSQNKALNGVGLSSTMLTGPGGVDPSTLTLGRTSLLGGGPPATGS